MHFNAAMPDHQEATTNSLGKRSDRSVTGFIQFGQHFTWWGETWAEMSNFWKKLIIWKIFNSSVKCNTTTVIQINFSDSWFKFKEIHQSSDCHHGSDCTFIYTCRADWVFVIKSCNWQIVRFCWCGSILSNYKQQIISDNLMVPCCVTVMSVFVSLTHIPLIY